MATDIDERLGAERDRTDTRRLRVAYVMSRFPKLSETFVLGEMLAVEELGVEVELFPLLRQRDDVVHSEARFLAQRARYQPFLSYSILASQLYFLRTQPRRYLRAFLDVVRGTWGSANFTVGAVGIFPKVAHAARLMATAGVDHVHCHFANHPALAGFVIHRLTDIPYSFTAHGSDLHVDRHMLSEKVAEASFVVPISEFNRDVILEECGDQARPKLVVIHCGVDTSFFHPPAHLPPEEPFSLLCVGTLHEVKGQRHLVEACRLLVESGVDVRCTFVGDGPDRGSLIRQIAAAGLGERAVLAGRRTRVEVSELLHSAHVLVAPSVPTRKGKREGIPVVLMEAMASGIPVVASRVSGIPELVADQVSGLLVPPGDALALAGAIGRLQADRGLRERLASAGRDKVSREFDVRANAAELVRRIEVVARVAA